MVFKFLRKKGPFWGLISGKRKEARDQGWSDEARRELSMILSLHCESVDRGETFRVMTDRLGVDSLEYRTSFAVVPGEKVRLRFVVNSLARVLPAVGTIVDVRCRMVKGKQEWEGLLQFTLDYRDDVTNLRNFINRYGVDTTEQRDIA